MNDTMNLAFGKPVFLMSKLLKSHEYFIDFIRPGVYLGKH
jgi:hypothetical protein